MFALFGVSWVLSSSVRETLLAWHDSCVGMKRKKAWGVAPLCLFWTIWKEINRRPFENEELKNLFSCNLFSWCKTYIFEALCPFVIYQLVGSSLKEGIVFCLPLLFWPSFGSHCIHLVYFGVLPFLRF